MGLSLLQRAVWEQGAAAVQVPGISKEEVLANAKSRDGKAQIAWFEGMTARQRRAVMLVKKVGAELVRAQLETLPANQLEASDYDWRSTGRPEQFAPDGDWDTWVVLAGRGFGKALALDTPIPTPSGWTTMGALSVGDELFDEKGRPCRVTFATEVQRDRACYEVVFDDGTTVIADAEHRWLTWDKAARKASGAGRRVRQLVMFAPAQQRQRVGPAVRTTEEIRATLIRGKERNHAIPVTGAIEGPRLDLPVPPYVLGVWLGDGASANATITSSDVETIEHIEAAGVACGQRKADVRSAAFRFSIGNEEPERGPDGRMRANGSLRCKLRDLGVLGRKHIPAAYLRASAAQRLELLKGLMDTDGYCQPNGNVEFCNTNEDLARGTLELALSLGFKAVMGVGRAMLDGRDTGPKYRVIWTPQSPVFKLRRKLARQHGKGAQAERTRRRYIADVRPVPSVPVRCIQVDSPSHLFLCSRAFIPTHNTMTGAEWVREKVERKQSRRPYIVGATASDVRDVMVEGPSGILAITPRISRPRFLPSKRRLIWPNGAIGILRSAEKPDRLRGPQGDLAWLDELPAWKYPQDAYDQIKFGLRLGRPQTCITTTPRPIRLLRQILKDARTRVTRGTTYDNLDNLSLRYIADMLRRYAGTRLGRQELDAEDLEDNPDALWKGVDIEAKRLSHAEFLKEHFSNLTRVVVAIDPATSESPKNAETGIVCCAIGWCSCNGKPEEHGYVLDDESGHLAARAWALAVGTLYQSRRADRVVAETNQGGNLVETNLRANAETRNLSYKGVHAKDGKKLRAEPVAALYEQHRVHHVGGFAALEDQMTQWNPKDVKTESPDRLDAAVHALTDLMLDAKPKTKQYPGESGEEQRTWRR